MPISCVVSHGAMVLIMALSWEHCVPETPQPSPAETATEAARMRYERCAERFPRDLWSLRTVALWSRRLMQAENYQASGPRDRVASAQAHLDRIAKAQDTLIQAMATGQELVPEFYLWAEYFRAEAQLLVSEAKDGLKPGPPPSQRGFGPLLRRWCTRTGGTT